MLGYAEPNFRLWKYDYDRKRTRLEMLQAIQRQTGKVSDELTSLPNLPPESAHVWAWWMDLHSKRQSGMGIAPVAWSDVEGYFGLIQTKPAQWEVSAICRLDTLYLWTQNPKNDKPVTGLGAFKKTKANRSD